MLGFACSEGLPLTGISFCVPCVGMTPRAWLPPEYPEFQGEEAALESQAASLGVRDSLAVGHWSPEPVSMFRDIHYSPSSECWEPEPCLSRSPASGCLEGGKLKSVDRLNDQPSHLTWICS